MTIFDAMRRAFSRKEITTSFLPTWQVGRAADPQVQFESMLRDGWRRNELIYACIKKSASTASQVELKVYDKRSGYELPDHPLKTLLQRPNSEMSEYDFWSSVLIYQKLAGKAAFEKERNRGGKVIALWPLRPDWVHAELSDRVSVARYVYRPPGTGSEIPLRREDILMFRVWDPEGLFSTWPPVAVAARSGDTDNMITDFLRTFITEGGTPLGVLTTKNRLNKEQAEQIRAAWRSRYGGWRNWLDPAVLDNDATYQRIGLTFREMGFETLDARSEARICMALDVPPILVGAKVGLDRATYSNYQEARKSWWEDTLLPMYADLLDVIINQLIPEFPDGDRITVAWDFSGVSALQEDLMQRWDRALRGLEAGAVTVNEFREIAGLRRIDSGDVFLRAPTNIPTLAKNKNNGHDNGKSVLTENERAEFERKFTDDLLQYFTEQQQRLIDELPVKGGDNGRG